jgi:ABC-type dipeptide/oligopeptide/nickel transport system permease component
MHLNATSQFIKINSQLKDDQSADKQLLDWMTNIKLANVEWLYKSETKSILDQNARRLPLTLKIVHGFEPEMIFESAINQNVDVFLR